MEKLYIFCPVDREGYQHLLDNVSPRLDDAGISFHICRPEDDITGYILRDKEVIP